ncbi:hypothetical protein FGO68_gene9837 [Halteria grandinella]|nr:hypothetical protein FGO68_gene9837 [Halteria grandinella]
MPEVFVSNYMKQQRNFVKYRREKSKLARSAPKDAQTGAVEIAKPLNLAPFEQIKPNVLVLAIRIKESSNATPQAQKILIQFGLKEVNNAVFIHSTPDNIKALILIQNYIAFGYPTKQLVNDLIRKRGNLKKDGKRVPLTDNNLIEEILGTSAGVICVEDIIDAVVNCASPDSHFEEVRQSLWPIQLHPLRETSTKGVVKHDATGADIKKRNTKVVKGGYLGLMGDKIDSFVRPLI